MISQENIVRSRALLSDDKEKQIQQIKGALCDIESLIDGAYYGIHKDLKLDSIKAEIARQIIIEYFLRLEEELGLREW